MRRREKMTKEKRNEGQRRERTKENFETEESFEFRKTRRKKGIKLQNQRIQSE